MIAPWSRSSDGTRRADMRGVSLLEMLLVVVLIGAVGVTVALAVGGGRERLQLRATAKQISSELRQARVTAIASGKEQAFRIDPRARRWQGAGTRNGDIPAALDVGFEGAAQLQQRQDEGVILFFPDGGSSGGRIDLRLNAAVWRIDVGWITGEVRSGPAAADTR